jgi:hypothetical protein
MLLIPCGKEGYAVRKREGERERETDRQTDRQTDADKLIPTGFCNHYTFYGLFRLHATTQCKTSYLKMLDV